jgi:hypothetical protein
VNFVFWGWKQSVCRFIFLNSRKCSHTHRPQGWTKGQIFSLGRKVYPREPSSPLSANIPPRMQSLPLGPSSPLGVNLSPGGKLMLLKTGLRVTIHLIVQKGSIEIENLKCIPSSLRIELAFTFLQVIHGNFRCKTFSSLYLISAFGRGNFCHHEIKLLFPLKSDDLLKAKDHATFSALDPMCHCL